MHSLLLLAYSVSETEKSESSRFISTCITYKYMFYILKGIFMKITIPILIVMAVGLLSGCSFLGIREIDIDIEYTWYDSGSILTINYTLINSGRVDLVDVVVTFGADLTTGGNNDYGDPEDLSISTPSVNIFRNSSESDSVTVATGGIPVHGVGVIKIGLDNPPDDN